MPLGIRNIEFLDLNQERRYPLVETANGVDVNKTFTLPTDFLVGLIFPVHWGETVMPGQFFIRKLIAQAAGYAITVGYHGVDEDKDVGVALVSRASHTENQVYNLGGMGDFVDSRGHLMIGKLESIDMQPAGEFTFEFDNTRLEPDCIRPQIRGITSIQVQNAGELSPELSGRIRLRSGSNHRLRVVTELGKDPVIWFDAISGEGLREECVCVTDAQPITSIGGVRPDGSGHISLLGNACFQITPGNAVLTIEDTCSQPCCGPAELEKIVEAMESFGARATTLEQFLVSLEARVSTMDMIVLGSRLGDRGCVPGQDCAETP